MISPTFESDRVVSGGTSQPKLFPGSLSYQLFLLLLSLFPLLSIQLAFPLTQLVLQEDGFALLSCPAAPRLRPSGFPYYSQVSCILKLISLLFSLEIFQSYLLETETLVCSGSRSTALSLQQESLGFNWPRKELAQPCHQSVVATVKVHQFPDIHHALAFYLAHVPSLPALVWEACKGLAEILAGQQVRIHPKKYQTSLAHPAHGLTLKKLEDIPSLNWLWSLHSKCLALAALSMLLYVDMKRQWQHEMYWRERRHWISSVCTRTGRLF